MNKIRAYYLKNEKRTTIAEIPQQNLIEWVVRFVSQRDLIRVAEQAELDEFLTGAYYSPDLHIGSLWVGMDLIPYYLDRA